MKKILFILMTVTLSYTLSGCSDDEWGNGDPSMEHIYYFGFEDWGTFKNDVVNKVNKGEVIPISVQYHSERVRSYDVVTYYYVSSDNLDYGKDYVVTDQSGNAIQPDANGAYSINWPQAKKGVVNIYVKCLRETPKYIYDESVINKEGLTQEKIEEAIKKEKARINLLNSFKVLTFDPNAGPIEHSDDKMNITNSKTNDYEVRAFTQNYFQTVYEFYVN